jgi:hypothetical protein
VYSIQNVNIIIHLISSNTRTVDKPTHIHELLSNGQSWEHRYCYPCPCYEAYRKSGGLTISIPSFCQCAASEQEAEWASTSSLDALEKRKTSCHCQELNPGSSKTEPSYYTNYITLILMWFILLCYCNNGNINRTVSQTQLRYYIKYTIGCGYMFQPLRGHFQATY